MNDDKAASSSPPPAEPPADAGQPVTAPDFALSSLPPAPPLTPGSLSEPVELPPELAAPLTKRDQALARNLAVGMTWQQACNACRVKRDGNVRRRGPSAALVTAAEYLTRESAIRCGMSRYWILQNCVALYRRACSAEPVLDRSGRPTGEWRFDGATAARMLQMLGEDIGMFGKGKQPGIGVDQVAALLDAVAARGRRQLEPDRGRLVGSGSAAIEKEQANQGPVSADSSIISQERPVSST